MYTTHYLTHSKGSRMETVSQKRSKAFALKHQSKKASISSRTANCNIERHYQKKITISEWIELHFL